MTYNEMVASLTTRMGGSLLRVVGQDTGEVDRVLTEAQEQVADEMVAFHGSTYMPILDDEADLEPRTNLYAERVAISSSASCLLHPCYHQAVVIGAARILSQKMGDANPKVKDGPRLDSQYAEALQRGHKVYALILNQNSVNRIVDGYAPDRHYEEVF